MSHHTARVMALINIFKAYGVAEPTLCRDNGGPVVGLSWDNNVFYVMIELKGDFLLLFTYNKATKTRKLLEVNVVRDFRTIDDAWTKRHLGNFILRASSAPSPGQLSRWARVLKLFKLNRRQNESS